MMLLMLYGAGVNAPPSYQTIAIDYQEYSPGVLKTFQETRRVFYQQGQVRESGFSSEVDQAMEALARDISYMIAAADLETQKFGKILKKTCFLFSGESFSFWNPLTSLVKMVKTTETLDQWVQSHKTSNDHEIFISKLTALLERNSQGMWVNLYIRKICSIDGSGKHDELARIVSELAKRSPVNKGIQTPPPELRVAALSLDECEFDLMTPLEKDADQSESTNSVLSSERNREEVEKVVDELAQYSPSNKLKLADLSLDDNEISFDSSPKKTPKSRVLTRQSSWSNLPMAVPRVVKVR